MNGFTNAVLTLLLGWLRSLFNAVWAAISSDGNGALMGFLCSQWKTVFIVLCVGGFVVDRIVYLFRWRPYYVWLSKRRSRAGRRNVAAETYAAPPVPAQNSGYMRPPEPEMQPNEDEEQTQLYQPPLHAASSPGFAPAYQYAAPAGGAIRQVPPSYSPSLSYEDEAESALPYRRPETYAPPFPQPMGDTAAYTVPTVSDASAILPDEAVDLSEWEAPQNGFQDFAPRVAAYAPITEPAVLTPAPEPGRMRRVSRLQNEQYLNDVRSGFAPPPAPEDLYASPEEPVWDGPVHPGLDLETFQQNIGLNRDDLAGAYDERDDMSAYPNFAPFTAASQDSSEEKVGKLGTLAKKARSFLHGEDENNPPSIRDLQSTIDVSNAFHAPVYPKKPPESGEE